VALRIHATSRAVCSLAVSAIVLLGSYAAWAAPNAVAVDVKDSKFTPASITVARGTTVTWRNGDEEPHTVTSIDGVFKSSALESGARVSYTFTKPGTYHYFCSFHPHMQADIIVQ
jgi:manganese oxidase